jgi:hypothetical protein
MAKVNIQPLKGINPQSLEPVVLIRIRVNRGDSGVVWRNFYFEDPTEAQEAFDLEEPANRCGVLEREPYLRDPSTGIYYETPELAD